MGSNNRTTFAFDFTKRVFSFFNNTYCDPFLSENSSGHGFLDRNEHDPFEANRFYCNQTKPRPTGRGWLYGYDVSNRSFVGGQFRSQDKQSWLTKGMPCFRWETIPFTKRKHFVKYEYKERQVPKTEPESVRANLIAQNIVASLHELLKKEQFANDPVSEGHLNELLESLNWEVVVLDNDREEHAFCRGDGKIYMHTGIFKHLRSDAEIAYVIGHEVAHTIARHSAEIPIFHTMDEKELEADYIGLLLMAAAGYDPRVAPLVLERLGISMMNRIQPDFIFTRDRPWTKRVERMKEPKVMFEALHIYNESRAGKDGDGSV